MAGAEPVGGKLVDIARMTRLRDSNGRHDDLWETFYIATAAHESATTLSNGARTALVDSVLTHRQVQGFFVEDDDAQRTADQAHRVMATWAAVSTLTMLGSEADLSTTEKWLQGVVAGCVGNPFVLGHAGEALALINPKSRAPVEVTCARQPASNMSDALVPPTTEEELLRLHGDILATPAPDRSQFASLLEPREDWSADPWWTGHAIRAYAAAGGDPADYRPLAEGIAGGLDANGLAAAFEIPTATAESDLSLIRIAQASGLEPAAFVLPAALVARASNESGAWAGPDWAQWVESMEALGTDIPQAQRAEIVDQLGVCVTQPVTPSTFRVVALCSAALTDLGQQTPKLTWESDAWSGSPDSAIAQCAAVLAGCADQTLVESRLRGAMVNLLATPAGVPTPVLAVLPDAARHSGTALSEDQLHVIADELDVRRGSDDADELYRVTRDATVIDFTSTAAALAFNRQENP
jgi:hypothetical protein